MISIVPYSTAWKGIFEQTAASLRQALGDTALQIHHIGSTSIIGLAAKDVVDIQVTVAQLDLPIQPLLENCGFEYSRNNPGDHCPPGLVLPASELAKKFYTKATPRIHLHIRQTGRFNQRYPLLCRDYLRTHPTAVKAYEEIKIQLARYFPNDVTAYYDIKDPVFDIIMAGAEEWASTTGWELPATDA